MLRVTLALGVAAALQVRALERKLSQDVHVWQREGQTVVSVDVHHCLMKRCLLFKMLSLLCCNYDLRAPARQSRCWTSNGGIHLVRSI